MPNLPLLCSSRLPLHAALLFAFVALPATAFAQVPTSSVTVDKVANYGTDSDPTLAGPGGFDYFDDSSFALGTAGDVGDLRAHTKAGGVDGTDDLNARSEVVQVSRFDPVGGTPGAPIDIDITISIDGQLRLSDFASSRTGNLLTTAQFGIDVITAAQTTSVYDGLGRYTNEKVGFTSSLVLSAFGDWEVSDFVCAGGICTIDETVVLDDIAFVMPGEAFAIESTLLVETVLNGARETFGESDFFNTGGFELSTDAPGVSFDFVVPEPASGMLLALALGAALTAGRRR